MIERVNRETRYNLIFLGVLVAVLLPGAVILFRKKLEPTVRPMYLPDPVMTEVAYLAPEPTPPGKRRVEPHHTKSWVQRIARERGIDDISRDAEGLPVVAQDKSFQLLAIVRDGELTRVTVLAWHSADGKWKLDGKEPDHERTEELEIPPLVRGELGEYGVVVPPKKVVVHELAFKGGEGGRLERGEAWVDFVTSFTKPAATGN
jgi:hypothetical protein